MRRMYRIYIDLEHFPSICISFLRRNSVFTYRGREFVCDIQTGHLKLITS